MRLPMFHSQISLLLSCIATLKIKMFPRCLTIIRHIAISSLEDQVDAVASSADLLDGLAVGHPGCTVPVYLHKLIAHL